MIEAATYRVELRLDGTLIGDVRSLAQNLTWTRRRTRVGVDSISFTLNDVLFADWCRQKNTTIEDLLKPYALDCRIVRNGVDIVGGYLATLPAYQPNQTSANLAMQFDGYQNFLSGVYIHPTATQSGAMGTLVKNWIEMADSRAEDAGKAFGFTAGTISSMASVEQTFDNYITVKDAIANRCDNTSGAGEFDVYWRANRTFDVIKDADFGDVITDYIVYYPMRLSGVSAASITAPEASGFVSTVIGLGAGEVSSNPDENTVITSTATDDDFVAEYGYREELIQDSSISVQSTLDRKVSTQLAIDSDVIWSPQITLLGRQVAPVPTGDGKIWIGDTITISNSQDMTGMTSGSFRVNELKVAISAAGAETITPTLERVI